MSPAAPARGPVLPGRVTLVEVGPRDGLQNEARRLATDDKLALIRRLAAAGITRIEATSFVHPGRVPQMADAEAVMAGVPRDRGVAYAGLVLNPRGAERAVAAGCDEIGSVVVATESFSLRNQGRSVADTLADWARIAAIARGAGRRLTVTIAAAFGCPFEGLVDPARVVALAEAALAAGPDEIALADTIGVAVPTQVVDLFHRLRAVAGAVPLRAHFHNTRNTGYANAYAALTAGVSALDASAGGIGGCPFAPAATGNVATEDLIYLLDGLGVRTGVDGPAVAALAPWLEDALGHPVPGQLGRAGFSTVVPRADPRPPDGLEPGPS
ncbi:(R)-citramalyl-CoA lyase [Methylobacterium crusticola]|uniref:(R)-citramalyl-CoA lyase n=1 Tax=Methylobacterium crusticola TaxID=1697972 RepID=A0ABQ4R3V9_9HYPH|nr:hydroxymethylglutaryl-CoA lyase [Methylobacterium crusticola]GJD52139.1 (R)-citramalyl-CoA lyase [Methylobacterium crusticola]